MGKKERRRSLGHADIFLFLIHLNSFFELKQVKIKQQVTALLLIDNFCLVVLAISVAAL